MRRSDASTGAARIDECGRRQAHGGGAGDGNICRSRHDRAATRRRSHERARQRKSVAPSDDTDGWRARAGVIAVSSRAIRACRRPSLRRSCSRSSERGAVAGAVLAAPSDRRARRIRCTPRSRRRSTYLPNICTTSRRRVWRAWRHARRLPGYRDGARAWWRDFRRDPTRNRDPPLRAGVRAGGRAAGRTSSHLHAHFLHTPASVTRYAALLRGLPWSCSAHAKDIWTTPEWEKREKLDACAWTTTCTEVNARHLRDLARPGRDRGPQSTTASTRTRFPAARRDAAIRATARDPQRPVRILAVGRAVDKKGLRRPAGRARATAAATGTGGSRTSAAGRCCAKLEALARSLGIAERVEWRGAQAHAARARRLSRRRHLRAAVPRQRATATATACPTCCSKPRASKLPCVSTRVSGIPELIERRRHRPPRRAARDRRARGGARAADRRPGATARAGRRRLRAHDDALLAGRRRRSPRGPLRRKPRAHAMKIAFYAPLKPPDHPVPSGDRQLARVAAAGAAHRGPRHVRRVAILRSFDASRRRDAPGAAARGRRAAGRALVAAPGASAHRPTSGSPTTSITRRPTGSARGEPCARHSLRRRRSVGRARNNATAHGRAAMRCAGRRDPRRRHDLSLNPRDLAGCARAGRARRE